ncbi:hypothetical protein [Mucilaginibacter phyllosphaerae]|uniref:Lipoprotein n=1 Tax=Mucilaginibacter phyllosphaerae TaxID=1812349 RepID=A0A4Y8AA25_9SPHI|nr:hypothetical protein [Mucilaginibacter phyllosphaerae]MBB3970668.1 hypothetical protein [Mucilaginibacter phyllosphaerae]TEW64671.1 hypothetical protein E2R65_16795 [Mucilaginibacter phyllosphaerae]GGH20166.1 hypothetical protein GCM10007352_32000 [Mucilaginibacter phyllosphaerae]
MKKLIYLLLISVVAAGCSYTTYNMNRGALKIPQKPTYQVEYMADIPAGTAATITYINKGNVKYIEQKYTGKFNKIIELPSGQDVKFTVDVSLPKTTPASRLATFVKVDGEIVSEQIQTGKNVKYRFEFKLP